MADACEKQSDKNVIDSMTVGYKVIINIRIKLLFLSFNTYSYDIT